MGESYSEILKVRVPPTMLRQLGDRAEREMLTVSDVVRRAIGRDLGIIEQEPREQTAEAQS